jgi:hypothetical protein
MAIAEVMAVLTAVNSLASAVSESAGHASSLSGIVGKLCNTQEKIHEVEKKHAGKLDQKSALDLALSKKRARTIQQQLADHLMMAGLHDVLKDMNQIMDEQRQAQEKEMATIKRKQRERRELMRLVGQLLGIGLSTFTIGMGALFLWLKVFN